MTKLEKVARAITKSIVEAIDYDAGGNPIEKEVDLVWRDYLPEARAALEALREPTEEMVKAAPPSMLKLEHFHGSGLHAWTPTLGGGPREIWAAMLESILKEGT